ncbi:hypothetical protein GE09DRAFT_1059001 [Coniochaeta sp. 2T2.1]|nr:hypothetical protein GE09DRAFT_1059001 [Coniochaeta sp. 2T2.1]
MQPFGCLPPFLYRVQHDHSAIIERPDGTLEAPYRVIQDADFGIRTFHIASTIGWHFQDRTIVPYSPYITLFSNLADAERHALDKWGLGHPNVRIYKIPTDSFRPGVMRLAVRLCFWVSQLRIWTGGPEGNTFVSAVDAHQALGVTLQPGQESRWLALDRIPGEIVLRQTVMTRGPVDGFASQVINVRLGRAVAGIRPVSEWVDGSVMLDTGPNGRRSQGRAIGPDPFHPHICFSKGKPLPFFWQIFCVQT